MLQVIERVRGLRKNERKNKEKCIGINEYVVVSLAETSPGPIM